MSMSREYVTMAMIRRRGACARGSEQANESEGTKASLFLLPRLLLRRRSMLAGERRVARRE